MIVSNFKLSGKKTIVKLMNLLIGFMFFFFMRRLFLKYILRWDVGRTVAIHNSVFFFDYKHMIIGDNVTINNGVYLDNRGGLSIGSNVNISHDCKIYTMGHDVNNPSFSALCHSVAIEDDVWIFPNVLIMPGVNIGKGAVVYPGSVVAKDVAPMSIIAGNPARFIRLRNAGAEYKLDNRVWFSK